MSIKIYILFLKEYNIKEIKDNNMKYTKKKKTVKQINTQGKEMLKIIKMIVLYKNLDKKHH